MNFDMMPATVDGVSDKYQSSFPKCWEIVFMKIPSYLWVEAKADKISNLSIARVNTTSSYSRARGIPADFKIKLETKVPPNKGV